MEKTTFRLVETRNCSIFVAQLFYKMMKSLKFFIVACMAAILCTPATAASVTAGQEYYIYLNIYEKLLGQNEAGDGPALSAFGKNTDATSYIFQAEAVSGKSGYYRLKQKSSGKYLAASGSNGYSVVLESASAPTNDRFCWKVDVGVASYLVNKKSGKYLGIDGANKGSNYVSVYYDKPKGSHSQYTVIPAKSTDFDATRQAYVSSVYKNAQGVQEIDYIQLNKSISRSDAVDIHVTANETPLMNGASVNLGSDRTWLIIDNIIPSTVASTYLKYVKINGAAAVKDKNCRIAIYLNGAAVIPLPQTVMTYTTAEGSFTLDKGNHSDLGAQNNKMTSFTLRRGYMATLASGTNGSGWSRVYVADHADLTVTLPEALKERVSSVNIKQWQYLSKKGYGDTSGANNGKQLRPTWYWSWNAGYSSTADMEFVPCRQHRWWPGVSEVNSHTSTAAMSINEPEHSEQHTSDKCSCGGTLDAWTTYGFTESFKAGGGRIGSPQPTDLSYLTQYFKYVDENNNQTRCDFAITHAYWDLGGRDASSYADWFCNTQCKNIWNNTKRPVWLTEMEISASWNSNKVTSYDQNRQYLQVLLQKIDECPWIERYAIYSFDMWQTYMFYEANVNKGMTPAGQVYRDHRATFAYNASYTKAPVWWRPSYNAPTLTTSANATENTLIFNLGNTNGDCAKTLELQRKRGDGDWQTIYAVSDRAELDKSTIAYALPANDVDREEDSYRVATTSIFSSTVKYSDVITVPLLANGTVVANSKTDIPGWTCVRNAQNGFTKADNGDTYFEVWGPTAAQMDFDYYQDIVGLKDGLYRLRANVFNSSNNVAADKVNGNVVLYAVADGVGYATRITDDCEMDASATTSVNNIAVMGGVMRIGVRNIGTMSARWAGADNFTLERTADIDSYEDYSSRLRTANQTFTQLFTGSNSSRDMTGLIGNPDCSRGTTDRWNVTNVGVTKGEASDGNADNQYFDKWNSGSLNSTMTQTVYYLPTGAYTLSALLRGSSDVTTLTLQAEVLRPDGTVVNTYTKSIKGIGADDVSGSAYKKGWQKVDVTGILVSKDQQLRITASGTANATAWWSADHFTLTWKKDQTGQTDIEELVVGIDDDIAVTAPRQHIFNLSGQRVRQPLRRGLYIIDGRKVVVK